MQGIKSDYKLEEKIQAIKSDYKLEEKIQGIKKEYKISLKMEYTLLKGYKRYKRCKNLI
nr:hypothetical protein [uncultured Peptostreptococcus sp.]